MGTMKIDSMRGREVSAGHRSRVCRRGAISLGSDTAGEP